VNGQAVVQFAPSDAFAFTLDYTYSTNEISQTRGEQTMWLQNSLSHVIFDGNSPVATPGYLRDIQNRLKKFVESGQLGPFMNGYWGNPAYKLPPEANLMAVTHYLEALDFQKEIVKIHTIFGGKNPHPNWLVGGVPCPINVDGTGEVLGPRNLSHRRPEAPFRPA